jgi:UDP-N-acetylglucosamine--N-acetylmuramyl-(pentapeptide) pyrophosphoryl-undecaprenol N-acetylglucosamine transferase
VIPESRLTEAVLTEQIGAVLSDPTGASMMAQAALSCGMPDAPQHLADMVEDLAHKGQKQ